MSQMQYKKLRSMKNTLLFLSILFLVYTSTSAQQNSLLPGNVHNQSVFFSSAYEDWKLNIEPGGPPSRDGFSVMPALEIQETEIRVDSIVVTGESTYYKVYNTYYPIGALQNSITQVDDFGVWVNYARTSFVYDASGNVITNTTFYWVDGAWDKSSEWTHTYDESGNRLSVLSLGWDSGVCVYQRLSTFTYDDKLNCIHVLYQTWEGDEWVNMQSSVYSYNILNKPETYLFRQWENDEWKEHTKVFYTYSIVGDLQSEMGFNYFMDEWHNLYYYHYGWDSIGQMTYKLSQNWDAFEGTWIDYVTDSISYNANGNWETWLSLHHGDTWGISSLRTRNLDTEGNLLMDTKQELLDSAWVNSTKGEYIFGQGKVVATAYDWAGVQWIESFMDNSLDIIISGNAVYNNSAKSLELYFTDVTGVEENLIYSDLELVSCYPNPAIERINIEINPAWQTESCLIELFNQSGQRVKSLKISSYFKSSASINVEDMPPGLYLLKFTTGKSAFTQKLIISK